MKFSCPFFATAEEVLDYVFMEMAATLESDADACEEAGDISEARELRAKIADIEAIRPHTKVTVL